MTIEEQMVLERYKTLTNGAEKELKPGMLAKWKPGMKNKKLPLYGRNAVVVEIKEAVLCTRADSGSPYFREPLDTVLGIVGEVDEDDIFILFHVDSRRLMPA